MQLNYLKELGVISALFSATNERNGTISVSTVEKSGLADRPVIADSPMFVATKNGEDLATASEVLSSDGDTIYLWNRKNNELIYKKLKDQYLVTSKKIKLKEKENKQMANEFGNLGDLGLGDLTDFGAGNTIPNEQPAPAVNGGAANGGVVAADAVKANGKFFNFCRRYGRFQAFITRNDAAIKVSKKQERQVGADGKYILNENATEADRASFNEGKSVRLAALVTKPKIVFKESKPSPIVGGILTIPQGAIESNDFISDLCDGREAKFDATKISTKTLVVTTERLLEIIFTMFNGEIIEDPEILGEKDCKIIVNMKETKKKSKDANVEAEKPTYKRVLSANRHGVSTKHPITPNNYIPLSIYETLSQQALTPESAQALNIAIEAVIKDSNTYNSLTADSKTDIKWNPENSECMVTSNFFKTGGACTPVPVVRFSDQLSTTDVMFPIRVKGVNKEGKTVYKYVTHKYNDPNGPLSKAQFADLLKKIKMTPEDFTDAATKLTKNTGKKKDDNTWSLNKYIENINSGNSDVSYDRIDTNDLFETLTGIA